MGVVGLEGMNHQNGWFFAFANSHNVPLRYERENTVSLPRNRVASDQGVFSATAWQEVELGRRKSSERSSSSALTVRAHFVPFLQNFENLSKNQRSWS